MFIYQFLHASGKVTKPCCISQVSMAGFAMFMFPLRIGGWIKNHFFSHQRGDVKLPWKINGWNLHIIHLERKMIFQTSMIIWLVVSTHLKNISQIGSSSQVGMTIKHIWNHHLVMFQPLISRGVKYDLRKPRFLRPFVSLTLFFLVFVWKLSWSTPRKVSLWGCVFLLKGGLQAFDNKKRDGNEHWDGEKTNKLNTNQWSGKQKLKDKVCFLKMFPWKGLTIKRKLKQQWHQWFYTNHFSRGWFV